MALYRELLNAVNMIIQFIRKQWTAYLSSVRRKERERYIVSANKPAEFGRIWTNATEKKMGRHKKAK